MTIPLLGIIPQILVTIKYNHSKQNTVHDVSNIKIRRRNENAHVVIENKPIIVNVTSKDVYTYKINPNV